MKAKAAMARMLARYALHIMQTYGHFDSLDDVVRLQDELALGVCQLLVRFYELMDDNAMHLFDAVKSEFQQVGNQLCILYARLSNMSFGRERMWKITPKLHWFLHLCIDMIAMGNPRFFWCYGDEDLIRIVVGIAETVHPRTLAISVLSKWLWCVFETVLIDIDQDLDA